MPELNIKDSIITSLNAQEPWPDNVKLFQPYEVEQILLPDNASCLAVQAFLKMCNLPFEVEMRWNAEFMSPSGRVPFIKCGAFVVSELEPIVQFAANKGVSLCSRLSTEEKAEMRAYMSLITNVLVNAELYISWLDNDTFNAVTKVRNSSVYPWPLGWIQTRSKRNMVAKRLKALHWHDKTLEQVLADVEQCCNSLSQRLGDRDYFFGSPSPLDALVAAHVRALLGAAGPRAPLVAAAVTSALLHHMLRVAAKTEMTLTSQEELVWRRRLSPSRAERSERSRHVHPLTSVEVLGPSKELFGFKPFASKHIILTMANNKLTRVPTQMPVDDECLFVKDIVEQIINKVEDITQRDNDDDNSEKEFDFIEHTKCNEEKNDYLDTIDEVESIHLGSEDVIKIIDSETDDEVVVVGDVSKEPEFVTELSQPESVAHSGGDHSLTKSIADTPRSQFSLPWTGSQSTLKVPVGEESEMRKADPPLESNFFDQLAEIVQVVEPDNTVEDKHMVDVDQIGNEDQKSGFDHRSGLDQMSEVDQMFDVDQMNEIDQMFDVDQMGDDDHTEGDQGVDIPDNSDNDLQKIEKP